MTMKTVFLFFFLLISGLTCGQTIVKGIVTEQNSGNKPISGVQIKALGSIPEVSDNKGTFQLVFENKKPGERIFISEISKKGYEVVNRKDVVDNWFISGNPIQKTRVVMCPEGMLAQNITKYYNISLNALTKGYKQGIKELVAERDKALLDGHDYAEKEKLLEEQYRNQQKQLEALAEKFARENFDDYTGVQKQAAEVFMQGDIEMAIQILVSVNSEEEIARAIRQKERGIQLALEGKLLQYQADSIIEMNIKKLMFQGQLYSTSFKYKEAAKVYETAVLADTTNYNNIKVLADFYRYQLSTYQKAEFWYIKAYSIAPNEYERASILRKIGETQRKMRSYKNSEINLKSALKMFRKFVESDSSSTDDVGYTLHELGLLKTDQQDFDEAAIYYKEGIQIFRNLTQEDSTDYLCLLAFIMDDYAALKNKMEEYPSAIACYLESLNFYKHLVNKEPEEYIEDLAITLLNIARSYNENNQFLNSEKYYLEALSVVKSYSLEKMIDAIDVWTIDDVYSGLASLYMKNRKNDKAKSVFQDKINFLRDLAKRQSEDYTEEIASTQESMNDMLEVYEKFNQAAKIYKAAIEKLNKKNYSGSEEDFLECLELYDDLNEEKTIDCNYEIALINRNLGILLKETERYEKSNDYYQESLKLFRKLNQQNPEKYQSELCKALENYVGLLKIIGQNQTEAEILSELALLENTSNQYENSKLHYAQSISLLKKLSKSDNSVSSNLIFSFIGLSNVQKNMFDYKEAEESLNEALSYAEILVKNDPDKNYYLVGIFNGIASLKCLMKESEEAEHFFQKALSTSRKNEVDSVFLVFTLSQIASYYNTSHNYKKAEEYYRELLGIQRALVLENEDHYLPIVAETLDSIAVLEYNLKQYDDAEKHLTEKLNIRKQLALKEPENQNLSIDVFNALSRLADFYQNLTQYEKAVTLFTQSVGILSNYLDYDDSTHSVKFLLAWTCQNLAWAQYRINPADAIKNQKTALNLFESLMPLEQAKMQLYQIGLLRMARYYLLTKNFTSAEEFATKANSIMETNMSKKNLAHALLFRDKYKLAEDIYLGLKNDNQIRALCLSDFDEFEKAGITHPDVAKIRKMLND